MNVSNETLLNIAKCQGQGTAFVMSELLREKPTGGKITPAPPPPKKKTWLSSDQGLSNDQALTARSGSRQLEFFLKIPLCHSQSASFFLSGFFYKVGVKSSG